jgi:hypothetical protein
MKYDRYKNFIVDGTYLKVPFVKVPENPTDCYIYYDASKMRMDLLSYQYYNDPNFGWLILQANPQYGSLEFMIDSGVRLRIPYPLETALQGYENEIKKYDKLYGLMN